MSEYKLIVLCVSKKRHTAFGLHADADAWRHDGEGGGNRSRQNTSEAYLYDSVDDGGGHAANGAVAERRLGNACEHGVGNYRRYDNVDGVHTIGTANSVFMVERKIS